MGTEYRMLEKIIAEKRKDVNKLVAKKKLLGDKIAKIIEDKNLETYQGIKKEEVVSKPRPTRMTRKEKEQHAIQKLRQMGIPNPRAALVEMGI